MDLKKFWKQNKRHVKPILTFAQRSIDDIVGMREVPNFIDYAKIGFAVKNNIDIAYGRNDPFSIFESKESWRALSISYQLKIAIYDFLRNSPTLQVQLLASLENQAALTVNVEDISFGWTLYEDDLEELYVSAEAVTTYSNVLSRIFWKSFPSNHVVLGVPEPKTILFQDDARGSKFFGTPRADLYAKEIEDYFRCGISRSILFYGPPGTGKSNLVKTIASRLGLKTLRINNISELSGSTISDTINIFNPDAIILEDIDNVNTKDISDLLDKLETFNRQKITFATANAVSELDNAVIRPGRFDETHQILYLDKEVIMNLVGNDEAIYEVVRTFPAAFITELMKRVKVKGRDVALATMQDLHDRLDNIDESNYDLKKSKSSKNEKDDEEDDEEDEDFLKG